MFPIFPRCPLDRRQHTRSWGRVKPRGAGCEELAGAGIGRNPRRGVVKAWRRGSIPGKNADRSAPLSRRRSGSGSSRPRGSGGRDRRREAGGTGGRDRQETPASRNPGRSFALCREAFRRGCSVVRTSFFGQRRLRRRQETPGGALQHQAGELVAGIGTGVDADPVDADLRPLPGTLAQAVLCGHPRAARHRSLRAIVTGRGSRPGPGQCAGKRPGDGRATVRVSGATIRFR